MKRESQLAIGKIINIGKFAWQKDLMAGFSGNISCRLNNNQILLTASGVAKGHLEPDDFITISAAGKKFAGKKQPSSESGLHLAIYAAFNDCNAILHTHPPYLQALELKFGTASFLQINLFEAAYWRERLVMTAAFKPGDSQLGQACVENLRAQWQAQPPYPCGAWLSGHGLCAMGVNLDQCLSFTEELEHIAKVQLLSNQSNFT